MPGLLETLPRLKQDWDQRLRPDDVEGDAPTDIGYIGNYLASCYRRADVGEFAAAFAFLEQCFINGANDVRLDCLFVLFPLWLLIGTRTSDARGFEERWLGPYSKIAWQECGTFSQLLEQGFTPFLSRQRAD